MLMCVPPPKGVGVAIVEYRLAPIVGCKENVMGLPRVYVTFVSLPEKAIFWTGGGGSTKLPEFREEKSSGGGKCPIFNEAGPLSNVKSGSGVLM